MEKYLSHNGNLIQRGANKLLYRNYTPGTNTYTAEYVGDAASFMSTSNTQFSIELQPNTYNIQYSAHYVLGQENRYNCQIGLYKSTEPNESEYVYSASYSAVSEDTTIVDISGTLEIDTSIGYDRFYPLKDGQNIFGKVSASITAQCYV